MTGRRTLAQFGVYLCLLLSILSLYPLWKNVQSADAWRSFSIRADGSGITEEEVAVLTARHGFTLWSAYAQADEVLVTRENARHNADGVSLCALYISGNATSFPAVDLLEGHLPNNTLRYQCAIDTQTAYALWGDSAALGNSLTVDQENTYIVCGVFRVPDEQKGLLILPATPEEEMSRIIFPSASAIRYDQVRALADEMAGADKTVIVDDTLFTLAMRAYWTGALFLTVLAAAFFLYRFGRASLSPKGRRIARWTLALFVATGIGVLLVQWAMRLPLCYLPNLWSDFEMIAETLNKIGDAATLHVGSTYLEMQKSTLLSDVRSSFFATCFLLMVSTFASIVATIPVTKDRRK